MTLIKKKKGEKRRKKETNQILSNLGKLGYQRIVELTTTGRVGKGGGARKEDARCLFLSRNGRG